ncbi:TetR/AcrR family transcriptional regulator [Gordonia sp. CPCC 205515]|uniref:TetR/AcrR family transcriptional regulator n=1 Tax=Gordonia sp. CPCC 205515 TaxID=3140791 RepID=UPI003AF3755C
MATLRELQKQQTRQLLLDTALAKFEEKGYAATTIDDIATAAGTTRATFYLHFPSKAEVMSELVRSADGLLTEADDPPLETVVEIGSRDLIRTWLDRKFTQWEILKPYMVVAHQAASIESDVDQAIEKWFDDTISSMQNGLASAGRFDAEDRRVRCILAFGQLEYLSQRWFRTGWITPREICLETLTDSWMSLLVGGS